MKASWKKRILDARKKCQRLGRRWHPGRELRLPQDRRALKELMDAVNALPNEKELGVIEASRKATSPRSRRVATLPQDADVRVDRPEAQNDPPSRRTSVLRSEAEKASDVSD